MYLLVVYPPLYDNKQPCHLIMTCMNLWQTRVCVHTSLPFLYLCLSPPYSAIGLHNNSSISVIGGDEGAHARAKHIIPPWGNGFRHCVSAITFLQSQIHY